VSSLLTAVVLTLNEEEHLPDCLASLKLLTGDVLVLDSGSSDATVGIATEHGARVIERAFDGYAHQRNAALDLLSDSQWVFFLDADERMTAAGVRELRDVTAQASERVAGIWVPRRNFFFGREVRAGGWSPDFQARGFRPQRARFHVERQVHEVAIIDGESLYLREPLIHLNYARRREFITKQRAYTERRVAQGASRPPRRRAYLSAPARELYRRLIVHRGYRDGLTGFFLASVLAVEEVRVCKMLRSGAQG
jgi:glycosyltransferase involved in cell wall biosynthesis